MKRFAGAMVAAAMLLAITPAYAQVFTTDDGRCAGGLIVDHGGHEGGHQLEGFKQDGKSWAPPFSLWGNQWNEEQKNYSSVAIKGFAGGHTVAALNATMADDPYGQCTVHADTITSLFYALRAKLLPDDAGDYDPFGIPKRREITAVNIFTSAILEGITAREKEGMEWFSSRRPLFDFYSEFYGN